MKFKAENFEATATEVGRALYYEPGGPVCSTYCVEAPGRESYSLLVNSVPGEGGEVRMMTRNGWVMMFRKPGAIEHALATAIAVLYSVPGVVCVGEP